MLTERQEKMLSIIVLDYIKNAKPVGSKAICERLGVSSATVRSEMANLEELGLLEKTHTSSGRVPSEAGYRYYVDHLMKPKEISGEDMLKLQIAFQNTSLELSDSVNMSLKLISEMTNYTTVFLGKTSHDNTLKEISMVPISDDQIILVLVTDKGYVGHKEERITNMNLAEIKKTIGLINELIVGTPIDEISSKLEFEIKPIIGRYVKEHETIYNMFYQAFNEFSRKNVNIVGKDHLLNQPEFNSIEKVKDVFSKINEDHIINLDKVEQNDNDINIYIGEESDINEDVTVIKTNYKNGASEGTIAIIGPKRMEYSRVVTLLEYLKKQIEGKE